MIIVDLRQLKNEMKLECIAKPPRKRLVIASLWLVISSLEIKNLFVYSASISSQTELFPGLALGCF